MRPLLFAVALLTLGFAPAPFPRTSRSGKELTDLERMQGTWDVVERTCAGRSVLRDPTQVRFTGKRFEFVVLGQVRSRWEILLNPTTTPRTLDRRGGPALAASATMLGIYRFDGDKLILCYAANGPRPTQFNGKGSEYLMTLRRAR